MTSLMIPEEKIGTVYGYPAVRSQNTKSNPNPKCLPICGTCIVLLLFIFLFSIMVITSFINTPNVDVHDVTLTQFTLSPPNNTLYYNLVANITVRNSYRIVGMEFDRIDAGLMYQDQHLVTKHIDVFSLAPKEEKSIVNVVLQGERVLELLNSDENLVYASENKSGVYKIGVNVTTVLTSKLIGLGIYSDSVTYDVMCDNLELTLNSVIATTKCSSSVRD